MYAYTVGQLYHPDQTRWPETQELSLRPTGAMLTFFLAKPTDGEIEGARTGRAMFAAIEGRHQLLLGYKILGLAKWSLASFTPHRNLDGNPAANNITTTEPGQHHLMHLILVDATTGIIEAQRAITWEARFAEAVRRIVDRLLTEPYDFAAVNDEFYAFDDTPEGIERLVLTRAVATCRGGVGARDN